MNLDPHTKKALKVLGERIRERRQELGWTLEESEEHGWPSWRHLQKIETGKNITVETLLKVCKLLKLEPSKLFRGL